MSPSVFCRLKIVAACSFDRPLKDLNWFSAQIEGILRDNRLPVKNKLVLLFVKKLFQCVPNN